MLSTIDNSTLLSKLDTTEQYLTTNLMYTKKELLALLNNSLRALQIQKKDCKVVIRFFTFMKTEAIKTLKA